jgi:hypothetical protein
MKRTQSTRVTRRPARRIMGAIMTPLNRAEQNLFDELREASPQLVAAVMLELTMRLGRDAIPSLERVLDALSAARKGRAIVQEALKAQEVNES